jgi:ankyrin repeat protein
MTKLANGPCEAMQAARAGVLLLALLLAVTARAGQAEDEALRAAAMKLDLAGVKAALARGADPNASSSDRRPLTPMSAMAFGVVSRPFPEVEPVALEIAQLLFASGAKLGPFDRESFFFFISEGSPQLVSLMLNRGASPTAQIDGLTPAEIALKYGHQHVYDLLVSRGAPPVKKEMSLQLALVQAAAMGDIPAMMGTLKQGARVNDPDAHNSTALVTAVRTPIYESKTADAIRWLLDRGADPNSLAESRLQGVDGVPLHVFVVMNSSTMKLDAKRPQIAKMAEGTMVYLLNAGAKVSGMDRNRKTPLHMAAQSDNVRAAELLIQHGARVMARDAKGRTPLDYAESASMIRLLKKSGATER